MSEPPAHRQVTLADEHGRQLFVRDWGPQDAPVVIGHHGTPSSSLAVPSGWQVGELGIRVITFDRPGYGRSTNCPGRSVADAAVWTRTIADELEVERFSVMGTSGGGPHAAAAAALLGDRVARLCISVGVGPDELPGFDPADGMLPETRTEIAAARAGEGELRRFIDTAMEAEVPLEAWFSQLAPADVEVLSRGDVRTEELAEEAEAMRSGTDGWFEDDLALFNRPWGCDLATISAEVLMVYGTDDVLVPASHGDAFREAIGHGQLVRVVGAGHWMRDVEPDILRWLAADDGRPAELTY